MIKTHFNEQTDMPHLDLKYGLSLRINFDNKILDFIVIPFLSITHSD